MSMFYWNGVYYTKSYDSIKVSPILGEKPATIRCEDKTYPIDHEALRVDVQDVYNIIRISTHMRGTQGRGPEYDVI